jgi:amidase
VMATPGVRWDGVTLPLAAAPPGLRLGVLPPPPSTHTQVLGQSHEWFAQLKQAGFVLIDVPEPAGWSTLLEQEFEVILYDFKADLNAYLARFNGRLPVRTLTDLIEFNLKHADTEMPFFGQDLFVQSQARGSRDNPGYQQALHHILEVSDSAGLAAIFSKYRVDALVAPANGPAELIDHVWGDRYENSGGWPPMCSAAAIAGYPSLTVPAGFVAGLPVGIAFVAPRFHDGLLLRIGRSFERVNKARRPPQLVSA